MARSFKACSAAVAVAAADEILQLLAGSTTPCIITGITISNTSDYADAQAEGLEVSINRFATNGSGGTAIASSPGEVGDTPDAVVTGAGGTHAMGTRTRLWAEAWNIQAPFKWRPTPEEYITVPAAGNLVVLIDGTPADPVTCIVGIEWLEIGG